VLKSLQIATAVLSAENTSTSSLLYPMLLGLVDDHLKFNNDDAPTVVTFKCTCGDAIVQRFALRDLAMATAIHVTAAVLDPRFRTLTGMLWLFLKYSRLMVGLLASIV